MTNDKIYELNWRPGFYIVNKLTNEPVLGAQRTFHSRKVAEEFLASAARDYNPDWLQTAHVIEIK